MGSVPFAVGAFSKLFLRYGCRDVRVEGLPTFLQALQSDRGVLTRESTCPGVQYSHSADLSECRSRKSR